MFVVGMLHQLGWVRGRRGQDGGDKKKEGGGRERGNCKEGKVR